MEANLASRVLRMFEERANFYSKQALAHQKRGEHDRAYQAWGMSSAYGDALDILAYAVADNEEAVAQFDYFGEE